ncbi:MAG: PEP-CTERM sorting domain-containing protein [Planctomycetes bacterium]|nr:PEP-CTERM sorting domain-containing protein [Planctomycetota bacterium]
MKRLCGVMLVLGVFVTVASADITEYTSRAAWEAAVGSADFVEDFAGFSVDTDFKYMVVDCNGFGITQTGYDYAFRNFIDVPPFTYTDNGGTTHASSYVNHAETGIDATNVEMRFDMPVFAWGARFYGAAGLELLDAQLVDSGGAVLDTLQILNGDSFFGFVSDPMMDVATVRLVARNLSGGSGGEGFGMDDVMGAYVPEPASLSLLALGGLVLLRRR